MNCEEVKYKCVLSHNILLVQLIHHLLHTLGKVHLTRFGILTSKPFTKNGANFDLEYYILHRCLFSL